MLSTENADLVRRDPGTPGLAVLLDPDAFINAIQPFIAVKGLIKATITYIRYKPATNCMIAYKLKIAGKTLLIYAKAYGADAVVKLKKVRERKNTAGPFGIGVVSLKDIGIVVYAFPNDNKLKTLSKLDETKKLRKLLLYKLFPDQPDLWKWKLRTLSYKPERRYVARLDAKKKSQAVLKFYTPQAFPSACTNATVFKSQKYLNIPKCLGRLEHHRVLAFNWLKGRMLREILLDDDNELAIRVVKNAGSALAELHNQRVVGLTHRSRNSEISVLYTISDNLVFLCPSLAEHSKNLARYLAEWLSDQPIVYKPIHGDFYAKQVLVDNGQISIVDFDEAVLGDPKADIGLFIAHMELDVLRGLLPANRVAPLADALLEGYNHITGEVIPSDINAYTAVGLFQLAHHPFRLFNPDWLTLTKAILERVEAYINKSSIEKSNCPTIRSVNRKEKEVNIPVIDPFRAGKDPKMPFLSRALDPCEAEDCLSQMFSSHSSEKCKIRLRNIRVVRYKPGRRCIVEYEAELVNHQKGNKIVKLLGKARAKRVDTATYYLCCTLWNNGFHAESPDGISIPQPVGIIPEMQMWFQQKVSGTPIINMLKKNRGIELSRRIAEAVHKLHEVSIPGRKKHTMTDELRILHERLTFVARTNPHWEQRLKRLLDACGRLGAAVPSNKSTGIHRDFYFDQVLVDGDRLYLVDLDLYCEGDSGLDIGNFIGHLTEYSLRVLGDAKALVGLENAMEDRFLQLAGNHFQTSVQAYATLTLARHIYISTQFPDRQLFTKSLLELCEQRLGIRQGISTHMAI